MNKNKLKCYKKRNKHNMNIYMSDFFPLSFKKCNKLDEYIYTYFFHYLKHTLKQFFL